ncbi:hypothetical protein BGZ49_002947 [Haplosporangium sp. Z 27]|nr:hypothetical protein BGZ49_002947 [Haplosporangium sp. Z 27]
MSSLNKRTNRRQSSESGLFSPPAVVTRIGKAQTDDDVSGMELSSHELTQRQPQQSTGEAEGRESSFDDGDELTQILSEGDTRLPDNEDDEIVPGPSTKILPAFLTAFRREDPTVLVSGSDSETGSLASMREKRRTAPLALLSPEKFTPAKVGKFAERTLDQAMADRTAIFCQSLSAQVRALEVKLTNDNRLPLLSDREQEQAEERCTLQFQRLTAESSDLDERGRHLDMIIRDLQDKRNRLRTLAQGRNEAWPQTLTVGDWDGTSQRAWVAKRGRDQEDGADDMVNQRRLKKSRTIQNVRFQSDEAENS